MCSWLFSPAAPGDPADLRIMYGLDGSRRMPEYTLDWLSGYEGSTPMRVGNTPQAFSHVDLVNTARHLGGSATTMTA